MDEIAESGNQAGEPQKNVYISKSGVFKFEQKKPKTAAHLTDFKPDLIKRRDYFFSFDSLYYASVISPSSNFVLRSRA